METVITVSKRSSYSIYSHYISCLPEILYGVIFFHGDQLPPYKVRI